MSALPCYKIIIGETYVVENIESDTTFLNVTQEFVLFLCDSELFASYIERVIVNLIIVLKAFGSILKAFKLRRCCDWRSVHFIKLQRIN